MNELKIQHDYVMEFFCRQEEKGGLGYRNESNIVVSNDLFIPSVLGEFVKNSQPDTWNRLLPKFDHDEQKLQTALKEKVKESLLDSQNVATFINSHKSITFEGEKVWLFYVSGTELKGDEEFKQNIFCAAEESSHKLMVGDMKLYGIRPDVMFFLNGIYLGYMELKSVTKGQTARDNGRQKVAKDYLATVKALTEQERRDPQVMKQRKEVMAIYDKAIHLTATDCNETYVMRGINQFFDTAHQGFAGESPKTVDNLIPLILETFKSYPVSSLSLNEKQRFEEVMRALYSKKMIEKEILYYNFIEYKYVKKDGAKERTSNTGHLIAPRPKQKFGCDKIMGRIQEMLDHEKEPNYYINKLRKEMQALGIPGPKIEEYILLRERYCNNKYVYSLLMQYAAGFGKSNIIGWTALQLKDYRYEGELAYDKVMIVVDRLQLRDQLDTMMMNMNIDKSMFVEAVDRDTFITALDSKIRIIVVNIQKFLDLQDALSAAGKKLKQMRVAFLIDEIHRSNSGENNQEMIDIFARLQQTFNVGSQTVVKKNLLIGFTATPSKETLSKFGEFKMTMTKHFWVPFDCYTMREAIEDGFILDPTKVIIPYAVPVDFQLPEEVEEDEEEDIDIVLRKQKIYDLEERMKKIASFVVERLLSLVYKKIRGEGKAMLAVTSIPNAIRYFYIIRDLYAKKCEEPDFIKYKDAPITIIYSDDQRHESCSTLNGGVSEEKVIQNFRQAKNGLIIVVDKLQTGFDEPKLHTLFLDKEISGINAIQTISRVNRKYNKHKEDCHIVDCSWKNVNVANIKQAFREYEDMVVSDFNPEGEAKLVSLIYRRMLASEPYQQWFSRYQHERENTRFVLDMEDGLRSWIEQCFNQEAAAKKHNEDNDLKPTDADYIPEINAARELRNMVGHYFSSIRMLQDVFVIDSKYYEEVFLMFWQIYCHIYREVANRNIEEPYEFEVIDSDEEPGITLVDDDGSGGGSGRPGPRGGSGPQRPKGKSMEQVLAILQRLHESEQLSAENAQVWLKEIGLMFHYIKADQEFCAYAKDDNYTEDEKFVEYKKVQSRYRRSLRTRIDFVQVERFKQMLIDNAEQLFAIFLSDLHHVENEESDFDYDTTSKGRISEEFSMETLIELAFALDRGRDESTIIPSNHNVNLYKEEDRGILMAAESFIPTNELTEEQRIDVLHKSLVQMFNHGGYRDSDKTFCKQRHWISVYRIAADEGFIIDGDFRYFKDVVNSTNLSKCKVPLNIELLKRSIKGIYASSFIDWNDSGMTGKNLNEYNDIKHCAEIFMQILSNNRPKK